MERRTLVTSLTHSHHTSIIFELEYYENLQQVREKLSQITSRIEKLNREIEIERCELEKEVEFWTNRGNEMMETLRFEMSELHEMKRLCSNDGSLSVSSSLGVGDDPVSTTIVGDEEKEEDEEIEEEKCVDVEIMI